MPPVKTTALPPADAPAARLTVLALLACCLLLAGCGKSYAPDTDDILVQSVPNREVIALEADDVVMIMRRAGFGDADILEHGTRLRNALARTGAARISYGRMTEALFMVVEEYVHVSSRRKGSFIYSTKVKMCI
jgi:hypothetical protein